MASLVIHIAIASEINKEIKHDYDKLLLGSVAPDISKELEQSKFYSHFLDGSDDNIPNIDKFLTKYQNNLNDDFVLGYFIHLYTDYLWFKYFIPEIYQKDVIKKIDGTSIKCVGRMVDTYIYNDYTNLNSELLDYYKINLDVFYKELPQIENIIEEIPIDKIKVTIDKALMIITKSREHKNYIFDTENIKTFITTSTELIIAKLKELNKI